LFRLPAIAQDTVKINLTYKHNLNDKGQSVGYVTVNQKFFTEEGILFREIEYDDRSAQIKAYTFYFYNNGKLLSEEHYSANNELIYIVSHNYNSRGHQILSVKLKPENGEYVDFEKYERAFYSDGRLKKTKYYKDNILYQIQKTTWNRSGRKTKESIKYKSDNSYAKQEIREFSYGTNNMLEEVKIDFKGSANTGGRDTYDYNEKGLLSAHYCYDKYGNITSSETFVYLESGALSLIRKFGADGELNELLQFEYKKNYMNKGVQESVL